MSRLVVLSNRVKLPDSGPMAGGLAVALEDVLMGNSVIWMGWNGDVIDTHDCCACATNKFDSSKQISLASAGELGASTTITYVTTALTSQQYAHFYCGFANNVLWPLLHEQPDLISQAPEDYAGYQAVNRLFARQLKKILQPDDVIWVHDYHFLSVAYYCRQLGIKNRIGFFLHIPFASLPYWQTLDKTPTLIEHLAHYDVLGTQTQQDKANCLAVVEHYLQSHFLKEPYLKESQITASYTEHGFFHTPKSVPTQLVLNLDWCNQHRLTINAYPIGVNVARIQNQVIDLSFQSAKNSQKKEAIKPATQQIIAVDRIDYSKGLLERFSAYHAFLQQYPMYQNQLQFLQIACPSRLDLPIYRRLYDDVTQAVNNINQQFSANEFKTGNIGGSDIKGRAGNINGSINHWNAITYSEEVLNHQALMTAFWQSDIGWVNSLKDGMNLVAKEYIAAQNPDNPGVLVLSCYAGAAEQMQAAVLIDPLQPSSVIQGLKTALEMPLSERKRRYQELLHGLQQNNLHVWQQDFLDDLYDDKRHQMNNEHLDVFQMPEPQE
ncbi:alpha,alpha-trehalose-phosphate synthase (UDP-forming) [Psychrobacter vallis]|uniref:alpha,alpha-trehalose-phosphate synthase (UDP-forming) n=1 Tax=Psychrobacter vallis TaxID=248451 RepID=UPI00191A12D8|nr:trehalose-6-phosphate synthase [Psychrobacter vallis]